MSLTFSHMPTNELLECDKLKKKSEQLISEVSSYKSTLWGFRYFIDKRYTQYLKDFCEYCSHIPDNKLIHNKLIHNNMQCIKREISYTHLTGERKNDELMEVFYLTNCHKTLGIICDKHYKKLDTHKKILQFSKCMISDNLDINLPGDVLQTVCSYLR